MRRMTFTDIYGICRLEKDEFVEIYAFSDYLKFLVYYPQLCHVIDVEGKLAAFIIGNTAIEGEVLYGHVSSVVVLRKYRRRGFATRLMLEFERACREELGCDFVNFFVNCNNKAALALYDRLGYRVHDRIPQYYYDTCDALDMRKSLRDSQ